MQHIQRIYFTAIFTTYIIFSSSVCIANQDESTLMQTEQHMLMPLWKPANTSTLSIQCTQSTANTEGTYSTSDKINYKANNWEQRLPADWAFFDIPEAMGKLLVIDTQLNNSVPKYRYLSNGTQHDLFEPWSSSKVLAYTGAMASLRDKYNIGGDGNIGQYNIADLISSIHSYEPHGTANGNSNSIASYFVNLASRDRLNRLLHKDWLNLSDAHIIFSGAYGADILAPQPHTWHQSSIDNGKALGDLIKNADDPGYLPYRCETCGVTGNKSMSTLTLAEWLKRLAMHASDPSTVHPYLTEADVDVLFHGTGHTNKNDVTAGMMSGISIQLSLAIARSLTQNPTLDANSAEKVLNQATDGRWRIYQKIGWGPSETRGTGENVMLAHVCLPLNDRNAVFTIAAQASHPGATEESVWRSGEKMQQILDKAMQALLNKRP